MKKKLFYLILLLLAVFSFGSLKAQAATSASGVWSDESTADGATGLNWTFDADTGTLSFTSGGILPIVTSEDYTEPRNWVDTTSTDHGSAIKKIIFEQPVVLPYDSSNIFSGLTSLEEIDGLEKIDASKVKSMRGIFIRCEKLKNIDGLRNWNTSSVESMQYMFYKTGIENLDSLALWDVSQVNDFGYMFGVAKNLKEINGLSQWRVDNAENLNGMFQECRAVESFDALSDWRFPKAVDISMMFNATSITNLNFLSKWDVSSVSDMWALFASCENLTNISALSNWDTRNLEQIAAFLQSTPIQNINALKNWNTDKVKSMDNAFYYCEKLEDITGISQWNTENVVVMHEMFTVCSSLKRADLSLWNTDNCEGFNYMFEDCVNLEFVDLSSWNTRKTAENYRAIFENCLKLKTIKLGQDSVFSSDANLPEIDQADGTSTGEWINRKEGKIYSSSENFMKEYDGTVPGEYVWRKSRAYNVTYMFKNEPDKALPEELAKLLPAPISERYDDEAVDSPLLSVTELETPVGKWVFKGWDKASVKISGADEVVTGIWQFIAKPLPNPEPEPTPTPEPEPTPIPIPIPNPTSPSAHAPNKPNPRNDAPSPVNQTPTPSQTAPAVLSNDTPKIKTILPKTGDRSDMLLTILGFLFIGSAVKYLISFKQHQSSK